MTQSNSAGPKIRG